MFLYVPILWPAQGDATLGFHTMELGEMENFIKGLCIRSSDECWMYQIDDITDQITVKSSFRNKPVKPLDQIAAVMYGYIVSPDGNIERPIVVWGWNILDMLTKIATKILKFYEERFEYKIVGVWCNSDLSTMQTLVAPVCVKYNESGEVVVPGFYFIEETHAIIDTKFLVNRSLIPESVEIPSSISIICDALCQLTSLEEFCNFLRGLDPNMGEVHIYEPDSADITSDICRLYTSKYRKILLESDNVFKTNSTDVSQTCIFHIVATKEDEKKVRDSISACKGILWCESDILFRAYAIELPKI